MDADAVLASRERKQLTSQRPSQLAENELREDEAQMTMATIGFVMNLRLRRKKTILNHPGSAVVVRPGPRDSRARRRLLLRLSTA